VEDTILQHAILSVPSCTIHRPEFGHRPIHSRTARGYHTATLLANGKVLVSGGYNLTTGNLASAELYDPTSETWTPTSSLATARQLHTATLLPNGKVLISGGENSTILTSTELYDPVAATWSSPAPSRLRVMVTPLRCCPMESTGQRRFQLNNRLSVSDELYDPSTGAWGSAGSLATARSGHTATLLPNGKVLVSGGENATSYLVSAELFTNPTKVFISNHQQELKMNVNITRLIRSALPLSLLVLTACSGSGSTSSSASGPTYTLGGTISGLFPGDSVIFKE